MADGAAWIGVAYAMDGDDGDALFRFCLLPICFGCGRGGCWFGSIGHERFSDSDGLGEGGHFGTKGSMCQGLFGGEVVQAGLSGLKPVVQWAESQR